MMTGYFCCEVMLPQDEFLSVDEFDAFLVKVDGKLSLHSKITYQQSSINNLQSSIFNLQSSISANYEIAHTKNRLTIDE